MGARTLTAPPRPELWAAGLGLPPTAAANPAEASGRAAAGAPGAFPVPAGPDPGAAVPAERVDEALGLLAHVVRELGRLAGQLVVRRGGRGAGKEREEESEGREEGGAARERHGDSMGP